MKVAAAELVPCEQRWNNLNTNYHVIAHTKESATVRLANKDAYDSAQVLDVDKRKDIALIKIKAVDLPFFAVGKSNTVDIGDQVFSLSTPLAFCRTRYPRVS